MSYILDALKRADSERERGLVPGLHAQPVPVETPVRGAYRAVKPLILLLACAGLVLLGVMLWRWLGPNTASAPVQVSAAPVAAPAVASPVPEKPVAPVAATPVVPAPAAPEAARPAAPEPAQAPRMVMAPAQITPAPSAATNPSGNPARERGADRAEPETRSETRSAPPRGMPPPAQPVNAQGATPAPAAPTARVAPLAELPADVRLAMPKLVISGATYADNPAYRMLIINGQVFHEGEKLATDLLLEQIGPKSAVLNFKGQRYSLAY